MSVRIRWKRAWRGKVCSDKNRSEEGRLCIMGEKHVNEDGSKSRGAECAQVQVPEVDRPRRRASGYSRQNVLNIKLPNI